MSFNSTGPSAGGGRGSQQGDSRPTPDPTTLTTEQLRRELSALRELLEARLDAMEQATALRVGATDRIPTDIKVAVDQIHQLHDKDIAHVRDLFSERDYRYTQSEKMFETAVLQTVESVDALRKLQDEKFASIAGQFVERDVRTTQASGAADDALKAALQAAKELVGAQGEASAAAAVKSETSFTKQIDQIGTIIQTLEKALDARITELKERIDRGEGASTGQREQIVDHRAELQSKVGVNSNVIGAIGAAVAFIALIITIATVVIALKP
jgi:hypothetical protein